MIRKSVLHLLTIPILLVSTLAATTTVRSSGLQHTSNSVSPQFIKNVGQWDSRVLFRAEAGGLTMWFANDGITYQYTRRTGERNRLADPDETGILLAESDGSTADVEQLVLTARLVDANPRPEIIAEGQLDYKTNYFIGAEPSNWRTNVPSYSTVTYREIYPGIDLVFSAEGNAGLSCRVVALRGADVERVRVTYEGGAEARVLANGKTGLQTQWGDELEVIAIGVDGTGFLSPRRSNSSDFEAAGQAVRQSKALAVELDYSTFLGGSSEDEALAIATDMSGDAYVAGYTESTDFPTHDGYQVSQGAGDVFVTKFSSSGVRLYSTYLGGSTNSETALGIAVDGQGNAYITGQTASSNFPTASPFQASRNGISDAFVTKLSATGDSLIYSTYLGGGNGEIGRSITVDRDGNAYVAGETLSSTFPVLNAYSSSHNGDNYDAFVTKLASAGNSLIFSSYLGGSGNDWGIGIAVDRNRNAYVVGHTTSTNFPTSHHYQADQGLTDVFVTKFAVAGSTIEYSTYLGGTGDDYSTGIALDGDGNAHLTGRTHSSDFPTENPLQSDQSGQDAFVTGLKAAGNGLIYSTYLGGSADESGRAIALDGDNRIFVTGYTRSANFPTQNPFQEFQGTGTTYDVFVAKLNVDAKNLVYSTCLGGAVDDYGYGIAVNGSGDALVAGYTSSTGFPLLEPAQGIFGGNPWDGFATKLVEKQYTCGDPNDDSGVDIADAVFIVEYIFAHGQAPDPVLAGDTNCDQEVDISDAVTLIAYIFSGGTAPCSGCR